MEIVQPIPTSALSQARGLTMRTHLTAVESGRSFPERWSRERTPCVWGWKFNWNNYSLTTGQSCSQDALRTTGAFHSNKISRNSVSKSNGRERFRKLVSRSLVLFSKFWKFRKFWAPSIQQKFPGRGSRQVWTVSFHSTRKTSFALIYTRF